VNDHQLRMPRLLAFYQEYLDRQDTAIFVNKVSEWYGSSTLERLVLHPRREIRRAAVLALGFVGQYEANHVLGLALQDDDRTVRTLAENSIRCIWTRAGSEEDRWELNAIMKLNAARQYEKVLRRATQLIQRAPAVAEAWNQRAFAHHALGRFAESIRDCHEALEINPYHFIAAVGMGRAYLELGNPVSALESFRRALRLNPDLEGVRAQVNRLERMLEGK
jgi:tetratricopeptide (TPR) repeat protein